MTVIVNDQDQILGLFTDGDLRRAFDHNIDIHKTIMKDVMTHTYKKIKPDLLAAEALHLMESYKITTLIVTDDSQKLLGVLHLHSLLEKGMN